MHTMNINVCIPYGRYHVCGYRCFQDHAVKLPLGRLLRIVRWACVLSHAGGLASGAHTLHISKSSPPALSG